MSPAEPREGGTVFVAISASGASTRSLEELLAHLPRLEAAAVVIILQRREALDAERLHAALRAAGGALTPVADGAPIEAGRVYLPDANLTVSVEGGRFRTRPAEGTAGHRGTIDSLLVSLARDQEGRVLAVALAGTDGEGTLGFKAVKEADGLALAEETDEVRADELGASDIPAALADAILPVDGLVGRIVSCVSHLADRPEAGGTEPGHPENAAGLAAIATTLRNRTGHDFHGYKAGTFLRRVQRRMQVVEAADIDAYIDILRTKPDEVQQLFNDLLIGVTRFFRDAGEFDRLEREIIPRLFAGKGRDDQVRIWVIGCSTGEEAYSLGILLREHMSGLDEVPQVQIFATDLDGRALASARVGRYADSIGRDLTPERLARWFVREGNTYCVVKELRELCIFSQHSIVRDAPFSRLDLVSCRNLLIYLDQELQSRIIPLFHFALRPGGALFLGNSENVSRHAHLFAPVEPHSRIFRRLETGSRVLPDFPFTAGVALTASPPSLPERARLSETALTRRAETFAERYAPAYVITDEAYNVLHFSGRTGRYIDPAGGAASLNLLQLVHRDLRLDLRMALARAGDEDRAVQLDGVRVGQNGGQLLIDVIVEPVRDGVGVPRNFFVLFKDGAALAAGEAAGTDTGQVAHTRRLETELRTTQERLQATNEELESTNEELKASNEEYQALNEELQSMNEELQTSKEELQSVNEELTTLNGELGHRVRELSRANSDLKNLMESTQIATLFLDNELRVANFTPAAVGLFHLVEPDVGRPIGHIKARVAYDELQDDVRRVLRTLATVDREIGDPETGARFMVRVLPYRSTDNYIAGAVVTFVDVTELRRGEARLRDREARYRALEAAAATVFRMSPDWGEMRQLEGRGFLADLRSPSADWMTAYIPPEDHPRVEAAIRRAVQGRSVFELEHRIRRADGSVGWTLSRAVPLLDEHGEIREWIGAASDITVRKADGRADGPAPGGTPGADRAGEQGSVKGNGRGGRGRH
ncbi:CheR family methyltransferase [Methylobacterium sp. NEAU 140]|uniref:CheR family methyltransferase n=1 Tax=Methylobacterium sp. NEAU 140 TaxID=3064945 RepID=UPI002735BDAB|nr:CheR family methyltransferase [Methylobacterium sp. NEAU 140]MDP4023544.1 CheR family methyltransferase [Methylobacterium sp. NEAU 140]